MVQVQWFRTFGLAVSVLTFSLTLAAQGDLAAIQQRLNAQFKLTTLTPGGLDIAETGAGDVVELHKDGLKMSALAAPLMESNTYKDGKIGGGTAKRVWGGLGAAMLMGVAAGLDTTGATVVPDAIPGHTAAAGEKFWVVGVTAQKDGINFKLYTDADDNGVRYHANLKILFSNKKQVPSVDAAMQLIAEVLTVLTQDNQADQGGQQAAAPPSEPAPESTLAPAPMPEIAPPPPPDDAPAPMPAIAPPPPPPDVAPPTVPLGQTQSQVIADFGEPIKVNYAGGKTVFLYKDMKVTFTNGKVSNVK